MALNFNNLAITATNSALSSGIGAGMNTLQSKLANGGRDTNCRFYYDYNAGGSILQVATRYLVGGAVSELKDIADNAFQKLMNGQKTKEFKESEWSKDTKDKNDEERNSFGKFKTEGGTILALDEWGCVAPEALMLGIAVDKDVTTTQTYMEMGGKLGGRLVSKPIKSKWLVWLAPLTDEKTILMYITYVGIVFLFN